MSLLKDATEFKKYDSRSIEKLITRGLVSEVDYKKYIETLPDDSDNAQFISLEEVAELNEK